MVDPLFAVVTTVFAVGIAWRVGYRRGYTAGYNAHIREIFRAYRGEQKHRPTRGKEVPRYTDVEAR
jgi:hypothetical protein